MDMPASLETASEPKTSKWVISMGALSGIVLVMALAVGAGLIFFAHPQADDLWACKMARQWGVSAAMAYRYLLWQGRWTSGLMEHGLGAMGDIRVQYPYVLGALWASGGIALFYVVSTVLDETRRVVRLMVAMSLGVIWWLGMPAPGQILYWTSGGLEHLLPVFLAIIDLCLLLNGPGKSAWSRIMITPLVAGLSVVTPGINEMWGCITLIPLTAGLVLSFWTKHRNRYLWLMAWICWTSSLAIVVLAPGNFVRLNAEGGRHGDWHLTPRHMRKWLVHWTSSPRLIVWVMVLVALQQVGILKGRWQAGGRGRWLGLTVLLWGAVTVVSFAIPSAIMGRKIPERVFDTILLAFVVGSFVFLAQLPRSAFLSGLFSRPVGQLGLGVLIGLFAVSVLGSGTFHQALDDLFIRAPRYSQVMNQRYRQLETHDRDKIDFVFAPIADYPKSYFSQNQITPNIRDYQNWHVAFFFKVRSVRTMETRSTTVEKAVDPASGLD